MNVYVWDWPAKNPAFPGDRDVCWRYANLPTGHMTMSPAYGRTAESARIDTITQLAGSGYNPVDLGSLDPRDENALNALIREVAQ